MPRGIEWDHGSVGRQKKQRREKGHRPSWSYGMSISQLAEHHVSRVFPQVTRAEQIEALYDNSVMYGTLNKPWCYMMPSTTAYLYSPACCTDSTKLSA